MHEYVNDVNAMNNEMKWPPDTCIVYFPVQNGWIDLTPLALTLVEVVNHSEPWFLRL